MHNTNTPRSFNFLQQRWVLQRTVLQ